jgi:hypothetical protein
MLLIAAFVVVGIHLPSYLDAVSAHPVGPGYLAGVAVAAMSFPMYVSGDPNGSLGMVLASGRVATWLVLLAGYLYRPTFRSEEKCYVNKF